MDHASAAKSGEHATVPRYLFRRADHGSPADRAFVLRILAEYVEHEGTGDDADARYRWLYRGNPHGEALTFLAFDPESDAPVGVTSLFPRRVIVAGEEIVGAIGGDGYVTPSHRRRGIVTCLHKEAMAAMREGAVAFMFGPPEPNNLRALVKAGARITGAVQRFTRPLSTAGLGRARRWLAPASPLVDRLLAPRRTPLRAVELGREPDVRVERVFRDLAEERRDRVTPVRDASFYAWRFAGSPAGVERGFLLLDGEVPVGAVAVERCGDVAAILDVVATQRWERAAYGAAADLCRGARTLHAQIHVPAPRLRTVLHAAGFVARAKKDFQVQVPDDHPKAALLTREDAWQYMWADGDVDHVI